MHDPVDGTIWQLEGNKGTQGHNMAAPMGGMQFRCVSPVHVIETMAEANTLIGLVIWTLWSLPRDFP